MNTCELGGYILLYENISADFELVHELAWEYFGSDLIEISGTCGGPNIAGIWTFFIRHNGLMSTLVTEIHNSMQILHRVFKEASR